MAPAKLNTKKKRLAGGPSTNPVPQGAASAVPGATGLPLTGSVASGVASGTIVERGVNSTPMTLDQAAQYYGRLAHDSKRLRFRLEFSLWIYEVVAVAVVNAMTYEETVEAVQLVAAVLAALWLGKLFLLKHFTESMPQSNWKRFVAARVLLLLGFIGAIIGVHAHYVGTIERDRWTTLGVVVTLDIVSIVNSVFSAYADSALKTTHAIELVFITGIFSTQYNHQPYLIFDRFAFVLTLAVSLAHYFVIHGTCDALFKTMWASEDYVSRNQQQRWHAVEEVHKLLDHGMTLKPLTSRGKKKDMKDLDEESDSSVTFHVQSSTDTKTELSRWVAVQAAVVFVQIIATSFFLYAWELCSVLMCTSIVLLFDVTRLRLSLDRANPLPSSVDDLLSAHIRSP